MLKIAVTGPNGLLGTSIIDLLQTSFTFIPLSHKDIDVTNKENVDRVLHKLDYDILLHLAAYTNVDKAEEEKEKAHLINVVGTKNIFDTVQQQNKKMIYISTDFVFDGENPPYDELSSPNPLGHYAKTKYEGEQIVENNAMIVRISYPYGASYSTKPDFVSRLSKLLEEGKELHMITDATITPTHIDDIAFALKHLMNNYSAEVFHVVGTETLSPFTAGKLIAEAFEHNTNLITPITFEEYEMNKAPRPQHSEIVSIKNNFYHMKKFSEAIKTL